ncbi:MAG: hypothetical protein H6575_19995 [Lewinellaceae bacterium]|nr:hypothetical protein [Lewinellaceae bacterium]
MKTLTDYEDNCTRGLRCTLPAYLGKVDACSERVYEEEVTYTQLKTNTSEDTKQKYTRAH